MNIFFLDRNQRQAAQYHCDKHVVKMILETAQLLSTAHHIHPYETRFLEEIYKKTHVNHPCAIWVRSSTEHYHWTFRLFEELLWEYRHRYDRTHASSRLLYPLSFFPNIPEINFQNPPQAMPDEYKSEDPVDAYRHYYAFGKYKILTYKNRPIPDFIQQYREQAT